LIGNIIPVNDGFTLDPICEHSAVTKCKVLIDLVDYSGAITAVPLFGNVAEFFLGKTTQEFAELDDQMMDELRKERLWRKYRLCFKVAPVSGPQINHSSRMIVLGCKEVAEA